MFSGMLGSRLEELAYGNFNSKREKKNKSLENQGSEADVVYICNSSTQEAENERKIVSSRPTWDI